MNLSETAALLAIGLSAGVCAGMFGIGGGLIIVPALVLLMRLPELQAIGTSLGVIAMPVMILGAIEHYKAGNLVPKYTLLIAAGVLLGAHFGAKVIIALPPSTAKRVYAGFLLVMGARMLVAGK